MTDGWMGGGMWLWTDGGVIVILPVVMIGKMSKIVARSRPTHEVNYLS